MSTEEQQKPKIPNMGKKLLNSQTRVIKSGYLRFKLRQAANVHAEMDYEMRVRDVYTRWRCMRSSDLKHFVRGLGPAWTLEDAFSLYRLIDWDGPTWYERPMLDKDRPLKPLGFQSLKFIDYRQSVRATTKFSVIPEFNKYQVDQYKKEHWWETYSQFHMNVERHHCDYWNLHNKPMTMEDTLELLIDHVVSAMRLRETMEAAFHLQMTWMYKMENRRPAVFDKFRRMCPYALTYFILYCASHGFSESHTKFIYKQSQSTRLNVYPYYQLQAMLQILANPFDIKLCSKIVNNHMHADKLQAFSCYKEMIQESQIHIRAVEALYKEFTGVGRMHDHGKMNHFMNAALCVKFLNFDGTTGHTLPSWVGRVNLVTQEMANETASFGIDLNFIGTHKDRDDLPCISANDKRLPPKIKKMFRQFISNLEHYFWISMVDDENYKSDDIDYFYNTYIRQPGSLVTADHFRRLVRTGYNPSLRRVLYNALVNGRLPIYLINLLIPDHSFLCMHFIEDPEIMNNLQSIHYLHQFYGFGEWSKKPFRMYPRTFDKYLGYSTQYALAVDYYKCFYWNYCENRLRHAKRYLKEPKTTFQHYSAMKRLGALKSAKKNSFNVLFFTALFGFHPCAVEMRYDDEMKFVTVDDAVLSAERAIIRRKDRKQFMEIMRERTGMPDMVNSFFEGVDPPTPSDSEDEYEIYHETARLPPTLFESHSIDISTIRQDDALAFKVYNIKKFVHQVHARYTDTDSSDDEDSIKVATEGSISPGYWIAMKKSVDEEWIPLEIFDRFLEEFPDNPLPFTKDDFLKNVGECENNVSAASDALTSLTTMSNKIVDTLTGFNFNQNQKVLQDLVVTLRDTASSYKRLSLEASNNMLNVSTSTMNATDKISGFVDGIDAKSLSDQLSSVMDSVVNLSDVMQLFFKKLSFFIPDFVTPFGFSIPSLKKLSIPDLTACVLLYLFYINTHGDLKYVYLLGLLYKLGILHQILKGCRWVLENCGILETPEETDSLPHETFSITDPIVSILQMVYNHKKYAVAIAAMVAIVGFVGYSHLETKGIKDVSAFHQKCVKNARDINFLGQGARGLGTLFTYAVTGFGVASKWVLENVFMKECKSYEEKQLTLFQQWIYHCNIFSTDMGYALLRTSIPYRDFAKKLLIQGEIFRKALLEGKLPRGCTMAHGVAMKQAKDIYNAVIAYDGRRVGRPCPRLVAFCSKISNNGKSHFMGHFVDLLYKRYWPKEPVLPFAITQSQITGDDWDNFYHTTKVVTMDDMHTLKTPEQAALLITLVSNAPFTVPCARINEKGMEFNSEFIVATTNTPRPDYDDIRNNHALLNRMHYMIEVEQNPDFANAFMPDGRFSASHFKQNYPDANMAEYPHLLFTWRDVVDGGGKLAEHANKTKINKMKYHDFLEAIFKCLDEDRDNDTLIRNDKAKMEKEMRSWYNGVIEMRQILEENYGLTIPFTEEITDPFGPGFDSKIDAKLIEQAKYASVFMQIDDIDSWCEDEITETKAVNMADFWNKSKNKPVFAGALTPEHKVFTFNQDLIDSMCNVGEIPIDISIIDVPGEKRYSAKHSSIAFPYEFYKYIKTHDQLASKYSNLALHIPVADRKKFTLFVDIHSTKDYHIIHSTQFLAALYRLLTAKPTDRLKFIREELIPRYQSCSFMANFKSYCKNAWATFKSLIRTCRDVAIQFKNWMCENWKINLVLLVSFGASIMLMRRLSGIMLGAPNETAAYGNAAQAKANRLLTPNERNSMETKVYEHIQQQANKLRKNQFLLIAKKNGGYSHGFGVKGELGVVNWHTLARYFADSSVDSVEFDIVRYPHYRTKHPVIITRNDYWRVGDKDQAYVKIKNQSFRDVTHLLCSDADYQANLVGSSVMIYSLDSGAESSTISTVEIQEYEQFYNYTTSSNRSYKEDHFFRLKTTVSGGASGSVVILPSKSALVMGIVSASNSESTLVSSINRDDALLAFDKLNCTHCSGPVAIIETFSESDLKFADYFEDHVPFVGAVPLEYQVTPYGKNEHRKSPVYGLVPFTTDKEPPILHVADERAKGRFPLARSVGKRSRDYKLVYEHELQKQASKSIFNDIRARCGRWRPEVCDVMTAITGRRKEGYAPIDLTTSPGLPYLLHRKQPGKKDFVQIDEEGNVSYVSVNLLEDVLNSVESMSKGIIPPNSLYDFPKADELLPHEKIIDCKTRSITNSNLCFSLIYRMFNIDFEALMHLNGSTGMWWYSPGINPESLAWECVYSRLRSTNTHGWCFDISNFDGGYDWQMYEVTTNIINDLYDDGHENARVRKCLAKNALNGSVNIGQLIYEPQRGMPSGFAGTTTYNTIGHMFRFYCAYLYIAYKTRNFHLANWSSFKKYVTCYIYGDDLTFTVSPTIQYWFNGNELAREYVRCGWKITMAVDKQDVDVDHPTMITGIPISMLIFLKRGFLRSPDVPMLCAPLDLNSINSLILWVRKNKFVTIIDQFYDNLYTSLFSLFHHGEKVFDEYIHNINKALIQSKYPPLNISYMEVLHIMLYRYYGELNCK